MGKQPGYFGIVQNRKEHSFMCSRSSNRSSNFEMIRIIAMLMIIGYHLAIHGVSLYQDPDTWFAGSAVNQIFTCFLVPGGQIGVALFFMITGYFQINRKRGSLKRVLLETCFYGVLLFALYEICHRLGMTDSVDPLTALQYLLTPVTGGGWWFITAYVFLMLMSPVLNAAAGKLNRRGYRLLLLIMWFFWYSLAKFGAPYNSLRRAIFFYAVGGYIRLYGSRYKTGEDRAMAAMLFCVFWMFSVLLYCVKADWTYYTQDADPAVWEETLQTQILPMINIAVCVPGCAVTLFGLFESADLGKNPVINRIAATTFGIYLLHDSPFVRSLLWQNLFQVDTVLYQKPLFPLYALLIIAAIFCAGSLIDAVRIRWIEPAALRQADRWEARWKKKYLKAEKSSPERRSQRP